MKIMDEIKYYNKEFVFEQYTRIILDYKDYEKITKVKMLEEIYKIYSDYKNIIEICTTRELKYLKMILKDEVISEDELLKNRLNDKHYKYEYEWERNILKDKFLIYFHHDKTVIPEEIIDYVKLAINNVKWSEKKTQDDLNEILVGYCKTQGSIMLNTATSFLSGITGIQEDSIRNHIVNNRLFRYYVYITFKNFDTIGKDIPLLVHQDYYGIEEELHEQRKLQGLAGSKKIDIRDYKILFYNDFNINNPKIKKFLYELESLPFFWFSSLQTIREFAMLNIDREALKKAIKNVPMLKYTDLTNFFKSMDAAMDEMPSGALNGFTPNEAKKLKKEKIEIEYNKEKRYKKQVNACLSQRDAKLFYKIYFALLEFTNNKYKINPNIKLYKKTGISPYLINDIIEKFWEKKEQIVMEFCIANPYKFNKEELKIISKFKNGKRSMFIIARYELEYTALIEKDRIYMVKGLNDNIDNIISYTDLPYVVMTAIIPFKNVLVYDGILQGTNIRMGNDFYNMIEREYNTLMKFYHL